MERGKRIGKGKDIQHDHCGCAAATHHAACATRQPSCTQRGGGTAWLQAMRTRLQEARRFLPSLACFEESFFETNRELVEKFQEGEAFLFALTMAAAASPKRLTLILLREMDQILLGMKKRGFGAGEWQHHTLRDPTNPTRSIAYTTLLTSYISRASSAVVLFLL